MCCNVVFADGSLCDIIILVHNVGLYVIVFCIFVVVYFVFIVIYIVSIVIYVVFIVIYAIVFAAILPEIFVVIRKFAFAGINTKQNGDEDDDDDEDDTFVILCAKKHCDVGRRKVGS